MGPPLHGSDSANTTAECLKEAVNKEKKHKVQEKNSKQSRPGTQKAYQVCGEK